MHRGTSQAAELARSIDDTRSIIIGSIERALARDHESIEEIIESTLRLNEDSEGFAFASTKETMRSDMLQRSAASQSAEEEVEHEDRWHQTKAS